MHHVIHAVKLLCYVGIAAAMGYLLGDEIQNRMQRTSLRHFCYVQQADELPDSPNELEDAVIQYRCRNAIP
jgi:hypothetical protein